MTAHNSTNVAKLATPDNTITEIGNIFDVAYQQCEAACAIIDAATVICVLERAPAHQDTHPSHNIITGAGHAHGLRVKIDTLPKMLAHAQSLVEMSMNDFDVMRETAITELRNGGAA